MRSGTEVGHYRLIEKIGEGGMGVVWKAEDTRLHRHVALKFVPEEDVERADAVDRHLREARAASTLNHPNICSIFDIGDWEGRRFIVMELLEGESLQEHIGSQPMDVEVAVELAIQIADALVAAHAKGIIHRDIKPANVFIVADGSSSPRAKMLDFGLATLAAGSTSGTGAEDETQTALGMTTPGTVMGTVSYMSPEQALGKDLDHRTDLFSLGVVLYEMVTARRAFAGDTSAAVFDAILNRVPTAPAGFNPEVSPQLESILDKVLEKEPELRYQSAAGLRADLKRLERDAPGETAQAPPGPDAVAPWWKSWWAVSGAALALAFGLWVARPWESGENATPRSAKRLTFSAGPEYSGNLSPDSTFVAYSHTKHGTMDLFMQPLEGGRVLRLTEAPGDELLPRWSRDGDAIAYVAGNGTECDIYRTSPTGGTPIKLVETGIPYLQSFWQAIFALGSMAWSPGDESLIFSRRLDTGEVAVFEVDLDSNEQKQITFPPAGAQDLSASWSFDGEQIVFARVQNGVSGLWVVPAEGGEPRAIVVDEFNHREPAFLPGGQRVVFTSNRSGPLNIWEVSLSSGRLSQLTFGGGADQWSSVSTDGLIVYTHHSHQTDLYTVSLEGVEPKRLTSWTQDNFVGRYSPDGSGIAYQSTRTGNSEIWILDAATGDEVNLTDNSAEDLLPAWSPDGEEIAFLSNREGAMNLWVAKADRSGRPERLSELEIPIPSVVWAVSLSTRWTPDGESIGYVVATKEGTSLWSIDRDGGRTTELRSGVLRFDWYLDRNRIVYTTLTESGLELRAAHLVTNEDRLLYSGPHTEMILAPDGSSIALVQSSSHFDQQLFQLQLEPPATAEGLPRAVGELERLTDGRGNWHVHNGSWSPDGQTIVYTQDTDDGDIYLIQNED